MVSCSSGKVLLAALKPVDRERFLARLGLPRLTARTITDPAALEEELARVLQQGYAVGRGETDQNVCGIAAPIRDRTGSTVAAVSVVIPSYRFVLPLEQWLIEAVPQAATQISLELLRADLPACSVAVS
jgi:DNA-binding IclR family transcriptional regulator